MGCATKGSRRFVLINHCSVFDLSFAKGAKARRRVARAEEGKKKRKKKEGGGVMLGRRENEQQWIC